LTDGDGLRACRRLQGPRRGDDSAESPQWQNRHRRRTGVRTQRQRRHALPGHIDWGEDRCRIRVHGPCPRTAAWEPVPGRFRRSPRHTAVGDSFPGARCRRAGRRMRGLRRRVGSDPGRQPCRRCAASFAATSVSTASRRRPDAGRTVRVI